MVYNIRQVKLPFEKLIHALRNFPEDAMNPDTLLPLAYSFKVLSSFLSPHFPIPIYMFVCWMTYFDFLKLCFSPKITSSDEDCHYMITKSASLKLTQNGFLSLKVLVTKHLSSLKFRASFRQHPLVTRLWVSSPIPLGCFSFSDES